MSLHGKQQGNKFNKQRIVALLLFQSRMLMPLGFLGGKPYKEGLNRQQSSDPWKALLVQLAMSLPHPKILALSFAKVRSWSSLQCVTQKKTEGSAGVQPVTTIPFSSICVLKKDICNSVLEEPRGLRQSCVCPGTWGNHQAQVRWMQTPLVLASWVYLKQMAFCLLPNRWNPGLSYQSGCFCLL